MTAIASDARSEVVATRLRLRRLRRLQELRQNSTAYLFLLPNLIFFTAFLLLPVVWVVRQSFMEGGIIGPASWVGLDNWRRAFSDADVLHSLRNTLVFSVLFVPIAITLAMVLALLLRRARRGGAAFRAVVYLPSLAPVVLAALVWVFLVNPDIGLLNFLNRALGLEPVNYLGDTSLALPTLVAVEVWRSVGFWALLLLAALLAVPKDLYQAAEIDGASPSQRFLHVTLPTIRAPLLVAILLAVLASMQWFDSTYALTGGGPAGATESAVFYIYRNTFEQGKVGYGAVLSLVLLVVIVAITVSLLRLLGPRDGADRRPRDLTTNRLLRSSTALATPLRRATAAVSLPIASRARRCFHRRTSRSTSTGPANRRRVLGRGFGVYLGILVFCVIALVPFLYILSASFKEQRALITYPPQWIPDPIYLGNYDRIISESPFPRWLFNTLLVASVVTLLKVIFDSMAGYAFAKMSFRGRKILFATMLAAVMIPPGVLIIPLFFIVRDVGLLDTYWALILPPLANPIGIFIVRSFIQGLPKDLENAARLDGCNALQIYWRVVVPLVRPALVIVAILTFLTQYLSFVWPLVATSSEKLYVLTVGLAKLRNFLIPDWGLISTGAMLTMVPIVIVFLLFQRRFVQASLAGALKE